MDEGKKPTTNSGPNNRQGYSETPQTKAETPPNKTLSDVIMKCATQKLTNIIH